VGFTGEKAIGNIVTPETSKDNNCVCRLRIAYKLTIIYFLESTVRCFLVNVWDDLNFLYCTCPESWNERWWSYIYILRRLICYGWLGVYICQHFVYVQRYILALLNTSIN